MKIYRPPVYWLLFCCFIRHVDQCHLQKKGFIWVYGSGRVESIVAGNGGSRSSCELTSGITSRKQKANWL